MSKNLIDIQEITEKLSALQAKILEKYTPEEAEKLHAELQECELSWLDYALRRVPEDSLFPEVFSKKGFSNNVERNDLFFYYVVLSIALAVLESAENFFPGFSGYEMLDVAKERIAKTVWNEIWPFGELPSPLSKSGESQRFSALRLLRVSTQGE